MSEHKDEAAEPIIIIRRGRHEDDHHHGGAWKIAYADFVTALMAFFLVMWLVNASNTETKASVASYFNPIKLTDSVARRKGLREIDEKANADSLPKREKPSPTKPADEKGKSEKSDKSERGASDAPSSMQLQLGLKDDNAAPAVKRERFDADSGSTTRSGRAFRDPFNPVEATSLAGKSGETRASDVPARKSSADAPDTKPVPPRSDGSGREAKAAAEQLEAAVAKLSQEVGAAVSRLGVTGGPAIDVTIEGDNIVMSLTDTSTFGMFAVSSAEPNELLVKLFQNLTPILAAYSDRIIVRGHTDSRPFRTDTKNNNWRLSMARAETAYTMLVRSGIEEMRFERIEGYADRKPKLPGDTEAAANRRIEIIMRRTSK